MSEIIYSFTAEDSGGLLALTRSALPNLPSGKVKSFLEHRQLAVDGVVTSRFDFPVRAGQTVTVRKHDPRETACPLKILYEDSDLLAVDKPAGLLTVANETERERTVRHLLESCGMRDLYVVHRLDRDTSGVLLFARSAEMRDLLQDTWDEVRVREYIAICEGVFEEKVGRMDTLLKETSTHLMYSSTDGTGKRAVTNYRVTKENSRYSQLLVNIETGRKNQIRVHMKELGHPVVGDKKYGAHGSPLKRLGLHASRLELLHPRTGAVLSIRSVPGRSFRLPADR